MGPATTPPSAAPSTTSSTAPATAPSTARGRSSRRTALVGVLAASALLLGACSSSTSSSDGGSAGTTTPGGALGVGTKPVGAGYEATIRRTTDGVPHIVGATLDDAVFGQGYASFEDRSCDLADQVLKVRSERAATLGAGTDDANVRSDVGWLALGLKERAERDWPQAPPAVRAELEAFSAGWNKALADIGVDGIDGWCKGQDWVRPVTAFDVYLYARSVMLQASGARVLDYIVKAQPPAPTTAATGASTGSGTPGPTATPASFAAIAATPVASNGWAIGSERSADGGGLLLANPHFPWEGELRFWESQLTVPGRVDIYGVQLSGLPGIGIGFTDTFGWTHTVSAGNRFTAYTLDLVPGKPTSYKYGDEERQMTTKDVSVTVKNPDGTSTTRTQTIWYSHYGPILNFPGVGWTDSATITYRDANIDNNAFLSQYLEMDQAKSLDEFIAAHERNQGVPLFNTIAVSEDGRAWYADTSATPNLSKQAQDAYVASLQTDPIAKVAAQSGAVVLDGSDPQYEWVDEPGARSPGLVPYSKMPKVERRDYVFNANDSFWLPNADHPLEGDYSVFHGRQQTPRSPRTRENATVLRDTSGPDGGRFDLSGLADAALRDEAFTARALRADVVARCQGVTTVPVPPLLDEKGAEALPAATIDISAACSALAGWDGIDDLDRRGAMVWRELVSRYDQAGLTDAGPLWAQPFDPAKPVDTPSGLAAAPAGGSPGDDPVLVNLARAVQIIETAGLPVDARLGDVQFSDRNGTKIPVPGGTNSDGTTNIIGWGSGTSTLEPVPSRSKTVAPRSALTADGYWVNNGSSFILALHFGPDGPEARAMLTYGQTQDRTSPLFTAQTERFSAKDWRTIVRTDDAIAGDPAFTEQIVRS